jgi:hypothetical protein
MEIAMAKAINSLSSRNKFAKRHYEAIALAMQEVGRSIEYAYAPEYVVKLAINELADMFARDNGQFKRDRFMHACEPGANVRARSNGGSR